PPDELSELARWFFPILMSGRQSVLNTNVHKHENEQISSTVQEMLEETGFWLVSE
ncbi:DinI family protein, partial [Escherichia coli]